ncbi:MAG: hypothetical protein ACJA2P_002814 [Rhodoferax sp.]|jgi:hypothetical protein
MPTQLNAPYRAQLLASLRGGKVSRTEASATHFSRPEGSTAQVNSARPEVHPGRARNTADTYGQCIEAVRRLRRPDCMPHRKPCVASTVSG